MALIRAESGDIGSNRARAYQRVTHADDPWGGRIVRLVEVQPALAEERLVSLDALRGFTIFWILGGDALAWSLKEMAIGQSGAWHAAASFISDQLSHADWEGFRFYDVIFPLLIFVTGVSIVYSLPKVVERRGRRAAHVRVLRRSLLLYALGVLYYGGFSEYWPDIRLVGVLQRIGICYLVASLFFLNLNLRGVLTSFVVLLVCYWVLMGFVPAPGIGAGLFEPEANLSFWLDARFLPGLKWNTTWDPEGLLSTMPAIGTCLLGILAGLLLQSGQTRECKVMFLMGAGVLAIGLGELWGLQFPVIKGIWTSSFVLVAGGCSLLLLGAFYQVIDIWGVKSWSLVFVWIGANAITLYLFNALVEFQNIAKRFVGGDIGAFLNDHVAPGTGRFAAATLGLFFAALLARYLYRHKIFVRV
jgi:predicted acyltransferase